MSPDQLKDLIQEVASERPEIGPLEESLKWGEQSFTPVKRNTGSSVRIQPRRWQPHRARQRAWIVTGPRSGSPSWW